MFVFASFVLVMGPYELHPHEDIRVDEGKGASVAGVYIEGASTA